MVGSVGRPKGVPEATQRRSTLYSSEPTSVFLPPPCGTCPVVFSRNSDWSGAAGSIRRPRDSFTRVA